MSKQERQIDILLAGVGGQGTVLASRVLAEAAVKSGRKTKTSETIGMAQREGSVTSHVRIGERVYSPLISPGQAHLLVGLEPAEAVRNLHFLNSDGMVLVNEEEVIPVTVSVGISKYDGTGVREYLTECTRQDSGQSRVKFINGSKLTREAGNTKALNSVMLGAICALGLVPIGKEMVLETLLSMVPAKTGEINKKAFNLGYETVLGLTS